MAPVMVSGVSAVTIAGVGLGVTQGQRHQGDQSKELSGENTRLLRCEDNNECDDMNLHDDYLAVLCFPQWLELKCCFPAR